MYVYIYSFILYLCAIITLSYRCNIYG
jgi:hypothetical protein